MFVISVRIPDHLLQEIDSHAEELQVPRAAYVRSALERRNATVAAERRRARLMEVSKRVRKEGMKVNAEFSEIGDALDP